MRTVIVTVNTSELLQLKSLVYSVVQQHINYNLKHAADGYFVGVCTMLSRTSIAGKPHAALSLTVASFHEDEPQRPARVDASPIGSIVDHPLIDGMNLQDYSRLVEMETGAILLAAGWQKGPDECPDEPANRAFIYIKKWNSR